MRCLAAKVAAAGLSAGVPYCPMDRLMHKCNVCAIQYNIEMVSILNVIWMFAPPSITASLNNEAGVYS